MENPWKTTAIIPADKLERSMTGIVGFRVMEPIRIIMTGIKRTTTFRLKIEEILSSIPSIVSVPVRTSAFVRKPKTA